MKDITKIKVTGLTGVTYIDKILDKKDHVASSNELRFEGTVDRVYKSFKQDTTSIVYEDKPAFDIIRDNLADTVIWNPWKEGAQAMSDFGPKDGWKHMVCVEAGQIMKSYL